ncbi:MAG TPA: response regulator [Candidatus Acidoferrales bacterium]|nr:response regulator [Candidatus Acidoferrales bacterium]
MPKKPLIAVVDDDESMRRTTKDLLESAGFRAATFKSAESFLKSSRRSGVACLITDMRMPGISGLALPDRLVASGTPIPTIIVTAYPEDGAQARAVAAGVCCYLAKPFAAQELLACIDRALAAGTPSHSGSV